MLVFSRPSLILILLAKIAIINIVFLLTVCSTDGLLPHENGVLNSAFIIYKYKYNANSDEKAYQLQHGWPIFNFTKSVNIMWPTDFRVGLLSLHGWWSH